MTVVITVPARHVENVAKKKGTLNQAVGRNLRAHRQRLGFSQEAYAHELGLDRAYWARIERGELNLSLDRLEALAVQVGVGAMRLLESPDDSN